MMLFGNRKGNETKRRKAPKWCDGDDPFPVWQMYLLFGLMVVCLGIAYPIVLHPMLKFTFGLNGKSAEEDAIGAVHPLRGRVLDKTSYDTKGVKIEPPKPKAEPHWTHYIVPASALFGALVVAYVIVVFCCGSYLDSIHSRYSEEVEERRAVERLNRVEVKFSETENVVKNILSQLETLAGSEREEALRVAGVAKDALLKLEKDKAVLKQRISEVKKHQV